MPRLHSLHRLRFGDQQSVLQIQQLTVIQGNRNLLGERLHGRALGSEKLAREREARSGESRSSAETMLGDIPQDVAARKPLTWIDIAETVVGEMLGCELLRLDGIRRTIRRARAIGTLEPKKSAPLNLTSNGALAKAEEASKRGLTPPCDSGKRLVGYSAASAASASALSASACSPAILMFACSSSQLFAFKRSAASRSMKPRPVCSRR